MVNVQLHIGAQETISGRCELVNSMSIRKQILHQVMHLVTQNGHAVFSSDMILQCNDEYYDCPFHSWTLSMFHVSLQTIRIVSLVMMFSRHKFGQKSETVNIDWPRDLAPLLKRPGFVTLHHWLFVTFSPVMFVHKNFACALTFCTVLVLTVFWNTILTSGVTLGAVDFLYFIPILCNVRSHLCDAFSVLLYMNIILDTVPPVTSNTYGYFGYRSTHHTSFNNLASVEFR